MLTCVILFICQVVPLRLVAFYIPENEVTVEAVAHACKRLIIVRMACMDCLDVNYGDKSAPFFCPEE